MTEAEAKAWLRARVSEGQMMRLTRLVELLSHAATTQNLIGPRTIETIWARHIVDSVQLLGCAPEGLSWTDIGSGAGLPGLALATCGASVTCVEPRRLRADWLVHAARHLALANVRVEYATAERVRGAVDVITARAVAPASRLIAMTFHLAHPGTRWVLPAGRSAREQLDLLPKEWQGRFHVERSVTDAEAGIIVATHVKKRQP